MIISNMINPIQHSKIISSTLSEDSKTQFHVAFGINQSYTRGMGIALYSLLKNNPKHDFHIHLFTTGLDENDEERLKNLAEKFPVIISLHLFDEAWLDELPTIGRYSKSIYFRLIIPAVVSSYSDRVLYIDADTLITGDLSPLFSLDFSGNTICACNDTLRARQTQCAALGLSKGNYFNSGMLLINLQQWNSRMTTQRICDLLLKRGSSFRFPDQDGLNICLENEVSILPGKYNYIYDIIANNVWHKIDVPKDTVMIHFTGKCKPWHAWSGGDLFVVYSHYYNESPWSSQPLDKPTGYKEIKRFARIKWHEKHYLASMHYTLKYIKFKFFN